MEITTVKSDSEVIEMLELQEKNLARNLDSEEIKAQGFVTVVHSFEVLQKMNRVEASVIAKDENRVIGYCLAMPLSFRKEVPILEPMFEMIETLSFGSKALKEVNFLVMGQVCIDKKYRGIGLFDRMYQKLKEVYAIKYEVLITEVAKRNQRSLKAHQRVGFETIYEYTDKRGEDWHLMLWNWRK